MHSELEQYCSFLLRIATPNLKWEREYRFAPPRRYRFDFAYPEKKVAIECEGGSFTLGRHNRSTGFRDDCRKYNLAVLSGWKVLRYTKEMLESGEAVDEIKALCAEQMGGPKTSLVR